MRFESENPIFESDVQMFREFSTDAQEHESLVEIKNRAKWSICNTIRNLFFGFYLILCRININ